MDFLEHIPFDLHKQIYAYLGMHPIAELIEEEISKMSIKEDHISYVDYYTYYHDYDSSDDDVDDYNDYITECLENERLNILKQILENKRRRLFSKIYFKRM